MSFGQTWLLKLQRVLNYGEHVAPRGKASLELPQSTIEVDMRYPVLTVAERKLNYQFMAAEAYWILTGDDTVAGIAPWNKNIAAFSDDGERFFGAYGPKIMAQLPYVVGKLWGDPMSRQAGLTIWRESPPQTKDYPCTIAMFFNIRDNKLNSHVFMRSSDLWLGVPYDVFNFSMVAHYVCCLLNTRANNRIEPGRLYLTAASSHLYATNFQQAAEIIPSNPLPSNPTPPSLWLSTHECLERLKKLRDSKPGDMIRWWEVRDET